MASLENDARFRRLRQWFEGLGGTTHASVEVYMDAVGGVALRAKPDAPAPVAGTIVSCPIAASLSYQDAVAQAAFPRAFLASVPPHVVGRFFLVQQFLLGAQSHWHPYIAALPQPDDYRAWALPAVWAARSPRALALLRGTNADVAATTMADLVTSEYAAAAAALGDDGAHGYTRALYEWAYCMFTSRSFRPSLVLPCFADSSDDGADAFSVLLPMLDLGNHGPAAEVAWERQAAAVDFCALTPTAAGQQILNNYGAKTNSELLVGYGFVLPPTPALHNDYVHLRKRGGPAELLPSGASGASANNETPPSFLLGLRQMTDASAVVGRARARMTRGVERSADFGRFEDGLLWDILQGICSADERDRLARYAAEAFGVSGDDKTMEDVYAAAPVSQLQAVIMDMVYGDEGGDDDDDDNSNEKEEFCMGKADAVRQTLTYKMYMDCKTLRSTDLDPDPDTDAAADGFEKLAAQYRQQYRAVLEEAFTSLSGEEYESDDE